MVAEAQLEHQRLALAGVGPRQRHTLPPGDADALVHHLPTQLGVGREGDVLLLHGNLASSSVLVHDNLGLLRVLAVEPDRLLEDLPRPRPPDAVAEVHKLARVEGGGMLEDGLAREVLPVGALHPAGRHVLVGLVVQLPQYQEPRHPADGVGGPPGVRGQGAELALEESPIDLGAQAAQLMGRVDHLHRHGFEHVRLTLVA